MMDSELNPEAPEFHPLPDPEMTTIVEEGYDHIKKATQTVNTFPIGDAHNLYQTFTDFDTVISVLRNNVMYQSIQIMFKELPTLPLRYEDHEIHTEKVIEYTDEVLDRVNVHIDTKTGENSSSSSTAAPGVVRSVPASWNRAPVVATIQTKEGPASLIGAKNIPRSQLSFKDPVDNSHSLFVPRLQDKPHSVKPLSFTIIYNDAGEPVGYEHPYETELLLYTPPPWALEAHDPPVFPPPLESAPSTLVETAPQLDALLRHLQTVSEIAIDLEHHSYRTYQGFTCLIQITTDEGGDFIVDALALRDQLHALNEVFTDPNKIKVFHGADNDVKWLQRDFGVYVVGLFDTHQAAQLLRHEGLALKHLLVKYCSYEADKTFQLADWRMRPLPAELVRYARADTHFLLYVWRRMRQELLEQGPTLLETAFRRSAEIAALTYVKPVTHSESHMWLYMKSGTKFGRAQMMALSAIWAWRDENARALDESPAYLLPNHLLLSLAAAMPRDLQGVRALADPMPPFLNHNMDALHRIILACREVPETPQVLTMPAGVRAMMSSAPVAIHLQNAAHDLTHVQYSLNQCLERQDNGAELMAPCELWMSPEFLTPPSSPACPQPKSPNFTPPGSRNYTPPESPTFTQPESINPCLVEKSRLNADAETFVPPYDRYRMYRVLCQAEEVKTLKEKEAKIASLEKDTEVIRETVLAGLQPTRDVCSPGELLRSYTVASTSAASTASTPATQEASTSAGPVAFTSAASVASTSVASVVSTSAASVASTSVASVVSTSAASVASTSSGPAVTPANTAQDDVSPRKRKITDKLDPKTAHTSAQHVKKHK